MVVTIGSCCSYGVSYLLMMRAYEVMKWDLPVCQQMSEKCRKTKEQIETDVNDERQLNNNRYHNYCPKVKSYTV